MIANACLYFTSTLNFTEEEVGFGRKVVDWFCGTGKSDAPEMTKEEKEEYMKKVTDIKETKMEKIILNVAAIIVMCISIFFWAFFG